MIWTSPIGLSAKAKSGFGDHYLRNQNKYVMKNSKTMDKNFIIVNAYTNIAASTMGIRYGMGKRGIWNVVILPWVWPVLLVRDIAISIKKSRYEKTGHNI